MYINVNLFSGFIFKKEGIVLYGYIDSNLALSRFCVYLLDSQVLRVLLSALTHCQLQNLQEVICLEDCKPLEFLCSDPVGLCLNQKTRSRSRARKYT